MNPTWKRCPVCHRWIRNAQGMGAHLGKHSRDDEAELKVIHVVGEPQSAVYKVEQSFGTGVLLHKRPK